jgi:hypothetical protein
VFSSDLTGVNPATLKGMILYYRLMTKWRGLGDSTELSRMGLSHPCRQFLFKMDEAPCPIRFNTFLTRSSEFFVFSGLVPGLLGVMFTSLLDLHRALRSCHKVPDELIPEVLLSTLKPYINTKLQNRHARTNLLYQGG